MNELKDYHHPQHHHHHNLDPSKIVQEYSTNQNEIHTTISNTSNLLINESPSSFHPILINSKKLTSATDGSTDTTSLLPTSPPLPVSSLHLQSTSCSSITVTSVTATPTIPSGDSQRSTESQHWYHHPHHPHHHPHHHHPHHHHHQLEEPNFLVFGTPNPNKLHDCSDGDYFNSRYNVKGIRNERTSSFFDIPAATHPYCYRFPSSTDLLKKELEEERAYQSHASSLHLNQHYHHHKVEYPDSTTNLSHHQSLTQSVPKSSTSDIHSFPYNNSGYTLRPADSSIVSSTEPEIGFGSLYPTCSPSLNNSLNQRRGSLQLWQFLVSLLDEPATSSGCIAWTGKGMEFKLIEPEEVARRWGIQKNRPAMNYDKLSRSLRYYYEKGIMQKVAGERYVYKFVCAPEALFSMAYGHENNFSSNNNNNNSNSNNNNNGTNNNAKVNNVTPILDDHHSVTEICSGGKLGSMYYNNSLHNNNFK